jgi:hypothetical protein
VAAFDYDMEGRLLRLRLVIHARASVVMPVAVGIPFLGFRAPRDTQQARFPLPPQGEVDRGEAPR